MSQKYPTLADLRKGSFPILSEMKPVMIDGKSALYSIMVDPRIAPSDKKVKYNFMLSKQKGAACWYEYAYRGYNTILTLSFSK